MPYEGTCLCKESKITIDGDAKPKFSTSCHCNDCRKCTGAPFSCVVGVPLNSIKVEGNVGTFEAKAASGNTVRRWFCKGCGSQLYLAATSEGADAYVHIGNIDAFANIPVRAEVFTKDRLHFVQPIPNAVQFELGA
ncbi:hypothetical protein AMATHDRAFT_160386 [Amanita thiersii Skay4041]|uniref:CENP-V/GFA domain-containing protein n=1 Tax=Amanita thiersii Skay4041 TaxID=703135 RepID=A0A2A9N8J0_9AGAR|nr:hypothetical protein AMATHDRAFT_160386 [Amanita thiersii Skay4041]